MAGREAGGPQTWRPNGHRIEDDGRAQLGRPAMATERDEGDRVDAVAVRQLCHDLRHPIATISALVAAAKVEAEVPPALVERLDQVADELSRLSALCRSVFERPPIPETQRLDLLVGEVTTGAGLVSPVPIELVADATVATIDPVGIRRAVWNLLDNACRAAGEGGRVVVTVRRTEGDVRVEVADSGPGFGAGPTGAAALGLSTVSDVARAHGGHLLLAGSELGGASVSLVLPAPAVDLTG